MTISPIQTLKTNTSTINALRFAPDGAHIHTGGRDGVLKTWSLQAGVQTSSFDGHRGAIVSLDMLASGDRGLTASADKTAILWDMKSGAAIAAYGPHTKRLIDAQFSPAGPQVFTLSEDGTISYWDEETGTPIAELPIEGAAKQSPFALLDTGLIVRCEANNTLAVVDITSEETLTTYLAPAGTLLRLIKSPSHSALGVLTGEGQLCVIDADDGALFENWQLSGKANGAIAFSPDGGLIAAASGCTIEAFDMREGMPAFTLMAGRKPVTALTFSAEGDALAAAQSDGVVSIWSVGAF